jgi:acyl transferase domain-containing protein/NADPH:quinone reductase-like Zn-dependent oxidoreductase/acyl carrier protein
LPVRVVTELQPWPRTSRRRLAGVSAFGFSGTNAHLIVEEAPVITREAPALDRPQHILCLSAKTEAALKEVAGSVALVLGYDPPLDLADVCYTANAGRGHLALRLSVVAATPGETAEALSTFAAGEPSRLIKTSHLKGGRPQLAFLYSGQGSQYPGMGHELFETQPVFRRALEECDEVLRPHLSRRLLDLLYGDAEGGGLEQTENTQPALFALEYALTKLWKSWGVVPAAVLGHSVGEYAAAWAAGVFSLEDGLKLIAARGRLMQRLCRPGAMMALDLDAERTASAVVGFEDRVAVAAFNSPSHTVIAGEGEVVERIVEELRASGVKATRLNVSHAFHSPLMDPMLEEFERVAREVAYQPPQVPLISNLTGRAVQSGEITDPGYWVRHVRNPVRFSDSILTAVAEGYGPFLEVGPHSTLAAMGARCASGSKQLWLSSLRQKRAEWPQILDTLRELYLAGVAIDWKSFDSEYARTWTPLPAYPFQRERFWVEASAAKPATAQTKQGFTPKTPDSHALLGERLRSSAFKGSVYQNRFSAFSPAFLDDHRIYSMIVVPGACHLSMALSAATLAAPDESVVMKEISFQEPLIVPDDGEKIVQLVLSPDGGETKYEVLSSSDGDDQWTLHATGRLLAPASCARSEDVTHVSHNGAGLLCPPLAAPEIKEIKERCTEEISTSRLFYRMMSRQGIQLGDGFQWVERLWRCDGEALGVLRGPRNSEEAAPYVIHPGLLDSCFQLMGGALSTKTLEASAYIPVSIERLRVFRRPVGALLNHVRLRPQDSHKDSFTADLLIFDESGLVVADISGLRIRQAPRSALMAFAQRRLRDSFYGFQWMEQAAPPPAVVSRDQVWLVFAGEGGIGEALAQAWEERGARVVLVSPGDDYSADGPSRYRLDPASPEMFDRVYREARATPDQEWAGVVFLWSAGENSPDASAAAVEQAQELGCRAVLYLVQTLGRVRTKSTPRLYFVTRHTQPVAEGTEPLSLAHAPLWGLARVIALEQPELRPVRIDLERTASDENNIRQLTQELAGDGREDQIAFRDGKRYILRLNRLAAERRQAGLSAPKGEPYQLIRSERGVLDELELRPSPRHKPGPGEIEVLVEATGLNFRDVLNALALYPGDAGPLGGECTGTVVAAGEGVTEFHPGDRVAAIGTGTFNLYTVIDSRMAVQVPEGMNSAVAATIPVAFVSAYYGLVHMARIQAGDRVLIHAAAGGVGLAAVRLAQLLGAEIYATAGSEAKRDHLRALGVQHIYSSRSLDFAKSLLEATHGRGVDIVLNSLAGEFIANSVSVLAKNGRFVELGKNQIWTAERMSRERPDVSYHTMQLDAIIVNQPAFVGEMLRDTMRLISEGQAQPLPLTEFPITEVVEAFRFMAHAGHIGKIIVTHPFSQGASAASEQPLLRADRTYLITGGLGALGLLLARWLADQGARHLTLVGRRAADEGQVEVANLRAAGVQMMVRQADVTAREDVEQLLREIRESAAPLGGVFHLAGVLNDGILMLQDWPRFRKALDPKMLGALHLDELTRQDPVEHFVLFSSAASILGSPSQGNYAAGNAFLDAIAHARRRRNLPALSINWGPWSEAGMAAEVSAEVQRQWAAMGLGSIAPRTGTASLELLMRDALTQVAVLPVDWSRLLKRFPAGMEPPLLADIVGDRQRGTEPSAVWLALVEKLTEALPGERKRILIHHIGEQAGRVLGLKDWQSLDPRAPLNELGLDSLMAVEMANQLSAQTGGAFPVTLLFDYSTIEKLAEFLLNSVLELGAPALKKKEAEAKGPKTSAEITDSLLDSLSELSDEEVDRRLNLEAQKTTGLG